MFPFVVVGIFLISYFLYRKIKKPKEKAFTLGHLGFYSLLLFWCAIIVSAIVFSFGLSINAEKIVFNEEIIELIPLQTANDNQYYIYIGNEDNLNKYYFNYIEKNKGIKSDVIPQKSTYINYTNNTNKAFIIKRTMEFKNPILKFITMKNYWEDMEYSLYIPNKNVIIGN